MRPAEDIKRLIKNARIKINPDVKRANLEELVNKLEKCKTVGSAGIKSNIWAIITKNRISQVAALLIVSSIICLFTWSDKGELEQHKTSSPKIVSISKTPVELVSAITLNKAFRDGGMQAMEEQFDKAEKKVKPMLQTRLTMDQLICELDGC